MVERKARQGKRGVIVSILLVITIILFLLVTYIVIANVSNFKLYAANWLCNICTEVMLLLLI